MNNIEKIIRDTLSSYENPSVDTRNKIYALARDIYIKSLQQNVDVSEHTKKELFLSLEKIITDIEQSYLEQNNYEYSQLNEKSLVEPRNLTKNFYYKKYIYCISILFLIIFIAFLLFYKNIFYYNSTKIDKLEANQIGYSNIGLGWISLLNFSNTDNFITEGQSKLEITQEQDKPVLDLTFMSENDYILLKVNNDLVSNFTGKTIIIDIIAKNMDDKKDVHLEISCNFGNSGCVEGYTFELENIRQDLLIENDLRTEELLADKLIKLSVKEADGATIRIYSIAAKEVKVKS
ncbi:hypothetical protein [Bartonella sp. DGB1]|uniref:hypothetical protein n=1 Tax=Bartonella sp. DGB1 TaxID=3239807 RepID=UPI0035238037